MDETRLLAVLSRMNVWWDGEDVPSSLRKADHRRRDFFVIRGRVDDGRRILAIRGPRQVGKTTICGQLIQWLLTRSIQWPPPERVLYLSADNSQVLSNPDNVIRDSLEVYERYVLERSFSDVDGPIYVFIDEIQKIDDWASVLKYYTDTYENLRFVVTGSVSTLIRQDASETLIGRIDEQVMLPMKYIDHVRYHGDLDEDTIYDASNELRDALKRSAYAGDSAEFVTEATGFYGMYEEKIPPLNARKDRYLLAGGYPGVLGDDLVDAYAKLDLDLRNTVTGDLATVFGVEKPEKVLSVLSMVMESTCGKINIQNIADSAGINRDTVERYLEYLEEFFLVSECPTYSTSEYRAGGRRKIYLQDVGLYNVLAGTMTEETLRNSDAMGPIVETAVCDHARRLQFNLSTGQNADIAYWDRRGEVDFVLAGTNYVLPIEVKHGDSTDKNLRGLRNFIQESAAQFGLAVNNGGAFEQDGDVIHVPSWLFFFLC